MKYDPKASPILRFHEAIAGFLSGDDTPRAYLERCLETIEALNQPYQPGSTKTRPLRALHQMPQQTDTKTAGHYRD